MRKTFERGSPEAEAALAYEQQRERNFHKLRISPPVLDLVRGVAGTAFLDGIRWAREWERTRNRRAVTCPHGYSLQDLRTGATSCRHGCG